MPLTRGITILDLISQVPPGAQGLIPDSVSRFVDLLNIADLHSRTSGNFIIHEGRAQSATKAGLELGPNFPVEIPGLNVGVPFQFSWLRADVGTDPDDLEGEPTGWLLDLVLDRVAVVIPMGKPAKLVQTSAVAPAHLEPGTGTRVKLYARGVLRLQGGQGGFDARLIVDPDPIVPTTEVGAIIETGFSPPHLLLHDSGAGMTVDKVILDLTDIFTPEDIVARGHGADFKGMTIREATLYLPRNIPFIGDVNLGVRDLLVGWHPTPALQGEARIELGIPLESAASIAFFQEIDGGVVALGGPTGPGAKLAVTVHADTGPTARLFAQIATSGVEAVWRLPDGNTREANDSGWFEVPMQPGARSLKVTERRTALDGTVTDGQERTYAFKRATVDKPEHAPFIRVLYSPSGFSHTWDDVVFLRGPGLAMDFVQFSAINDTSLPDDEIPDLRWQWEKEGTTRSGSGLDFNLDTGWSQGTHSVTLTDKHGNVRRCRIEVTAIGDLFVGKRGIAGVSDVRQVRPGNDVAAPILSVENPWDLRAFHASDAREPARNTATFEDGVLIVPEGTLAEVTIGIGTPEDPTETAPTTEPLPRHARIRMEYNDAIPKEWRLIRGTGTSSYGPNEPYPTFSGSIAQTSAPEEQLDTTFTTDDLTTWASAFPADTRFVVIGRCCDIGTELRNRDLASERAARGAELLQSAGIAADRVRFVGEQGPTGAEPEPAYDSALQFAGPALDPLADPDLGPHVQEGWRFKNVYSQATRDAWRAAQDQPERKEARGIDIYAIVPAATPAPAPTPTNQTTENPSLIRALVPGDNAVVIEPIDPATVPLPYRVEAIVKWDSPSIVETIDWVPTLIQLTLEWASSNIQVPGLPEGEEVTPTRPNPPSTPSSEPDLWRLIGRFTTDQRSGQTAYFLSVDSMGDSDGLFAIVNGGATSRADEVIAVAAALAPALMGGISTDDPAGAAVRSAALIAAAIAAASVEISGTFVINEGRVIVEKIEGEVQMRAIDAVEGMKVRIGVDYTASFGVMADVLGAVGVQTLQPVKIKYKNVGVEYIHDELLPILERIRFVFEDAKFEVSDPGQWSITGALGEFLGITAIRIGAGSVWAEVDLEFSLDLGVVEISRTTIRIEIDASGPSPSVSVSIRSITASIDVPSAIKGAGELMILPDGFGASVELEVIPAKLKAWGAFAIREPSMVHIEGGVRFATGIPLGNTGLGLFGFAGRFVANGGRDVDLTDTDIIGREIGWHARSPILKYRPQPGQFAVGFGAYIGTMPDAAFTFSALGMLTVGFPDISVVFAIDATLLSAETKSATETKPEPPPTALTLLGIVAIDPNAVGIAIQGRYLIPRLLDIQVPIGAFFPIQSTGAAAYVRIGSDGAGGRPDRPITAIILPDILDLRAFAYFMVEEKRLHDLGGKSHLDFDGFSIGFGAGLSVKWGGSSVYLKASLTLLVGIGTRPFVLAGGIYVQGELRLVCVSISVRGEIEATVVDSGAELKGEFCGKVDFFFFSVKGCVRFNVSTGSTAIPAPPAEPLIVGLTLSDKFSRVVGEGAVSLGAIGTANTAWPDVAPVLKFSHRVRVNISGTGFRPTPSNGWPGVDWSGTNRIRYLYELNGVELIKHPASGPADVVDTSTWPSVWWLPAFRNAIPDTTSTPSSSHEGWDLALLHWDPAPWSRAHGDGGDGIEADPADSLGNLCEEPPFPTLYCVLGRDGQRLDIGRVRITGEPSGQTPYAPDFYVNLVEGMPPTLGVAQLATLASAMGVGFSSGGASALQPPFTPPGESTALTHTWQTPRFTKNGFTTMSLGMQGDFIAEVSEPQLLLSVCLEVPDQGGRRETCLDFRRIPLHEVFGASIDVDGVKIEDLGESLRSRDTFPLDADDGVAELAFSSKGMTATLPQDADSVSLDVGVLEDKVALVLAMDASGNEVARAEQRAQEPSVLRFDLRGPGIRQVTVWTSHSTGSLNRFCFTTPGQDNEGAVVKRLVGALADSGQLPRVSGVRGGITEGWVGEVVGVQVEGRHGCAFVNYMPRVSGPWSRFIVAPFPQFAVGLVRVCGIRHGALVSAEQDDDAREELQDLWNTAVLGLLEDRHQLLEANTRYEVRVNYKAATWVGADATENPPNANTFDFAATPPSDITVDTSASQSLFFRTAAFGSLADEKVLDFSEQRTFDPRGLARYLRGFSPDAEEPSHFLDDSLLVWFNVEWVRDLLDLYERDLDIVVQRTDVPPTDPSGVPPIVFPPFTVGWKGLPYELRDLADRRMIDVAVLSPCLEDAPVEGATAEVLVELEPRVRYDLIVRAKPQGAGQSIEIGRSHFRASRYANVTELVEASGFGVARPNSFYPPDLLVTTAPPTDVRLNDDGLLDAAISAMGLDPFAPAVGPRSLALWQEVSGVWRLVGVLVDSDEALIRAPRLVDPLPNPPRMQILRARVSNVPPLEPDELIPVRSNSSATRVLLSVAGGIVVPDNAVIELDVQEPSGLVTGRRSLLSVPLLIAQERS